MRTERADGAVACASAHLKNVQSELGLADRHFCLDQPAPIKELRRILQQRPTETPGNRT